MVVRPLVILTLVLTLWLQALPAYACFGPKLFLGVPDDLRGQVLTSLVAIYVKEKTGVETNRVNLSGKDVLSEIRAEQLDFGFSATSDPELSVVLQIDQLPTLYSGPRIGSDLQFTTVAPALKRLQRTLKPEHVDQILAEVEKGSIPMAAARRFLMKERWI